MLIDTHAHLDFPPFDDNRSEVIQRALAELGLIINAGANLESSQKSVELAKNYPQIYAAVGIHPQDAQEVESLSQAMEKLRALAKNPKVVAIGECGLDYHGENIDKEKQKKFFKAQLDLAKEINLPVIIHCRDTQNEILQLIKAPLKGVFHCFSGDKEFLKKVLDLCFYVGFCGNLTFKNAKELQEVAKIAPLERILLETDSPYLSPEPFRGLRNEPKNVKIICEFIAALKGLAPNEVAQTTTENAKKLFNKTR